MTAALVVLLGLAAEPAEMAEAADPVVAGREALGGWWGYPWYDSQADSFRPVKLSEPWDLDWLPDGPLVSVAVLRMGAWVLLGLLLAAIAYHLLRAQLRRRRPDLPAAGVPGDAARIDALPLARPRGDLLEEARRLYAAGDYAEAILYLFSYQLLRLDRRRFIELAKGKTNRQYLGELGRRGDLRRLVEHSMVAFEDVFFGGRTLDRRRFEGCWNTLDRFERLLEESAP